MTRHHGFLDDAKIRTKGPGTSGVYIGGAEGATAPRTFLSENLELAGKFEGGYFRLLRSQKTFRTRNIKNWTFVDHKK